MWDIPTVIILSKYLKRDKVVKYIEKVSDFNITDEIKIIEKKGMEGLK